VENLETIIRDWNRFNTRISMFIILSIIIYLITNWANFKFSILSRRHIKLTIAAFISIYFAFFAFNHLTLLLDKFYPSFISNDPFLDRTTLLAKIKEFRADRYVFHINEQFDLLSVNFCLSIYFLINAISDFKKK